MHYLADLLTLTRLILATAILIWGFTSTPLEWALIAFLIAELTDAFDGTCATKWPFPKGKVPKYRKYSAKYDTLTDTFLIITTLLFLIFRVNWLAGLIIGITYAIMALAIDLIVYGKIAGHPDDNKSNSLVNRNFPLAKKIILTRRMVYLVLIATLTIWLLCISDWPIILKIIIAAITIIISIFLWFFESQRRHHISRNAVDIEHKLSKQQKS